ncbi:MAG TPA: dihydrofolate reductase family protein [Oscillatoriales cyanobacterium M59_W2019_021]|nr:dihydrofolate reductase family protein [Oscillatoriales cyanobacterium M59_W2019_021]
MTNRPKTTVVLAMSADGKISDVDRSSQLFGSDTDFAHLERLVALSDSVIVGAGTLRAGGSAMRVQNPDLIAERERQGKPPQPVQVVCSVSGDIDPELMFFRQDVPRWLVTTENGAKPWQDGDLFHRVIVAQTPQETVDLPAAFEELGNLGIASLAVLGGGGFIGTLFWAGLIDELWLTVCPRIIGGAKAPSPVDGEGFSLENAPRLELLESKTIEGEVFLHYRVLGNSERRDC